MHHHDEIPVVVRRNRLSKLIDEKVVEAFAIRAEPLVIGFPCRPGGHTGTDTLAARIVFEPEHVDIRADEDIEKILAERRPTG